MTKNEASPEGQVEAATDEQVDSFFECLKEAIWVHMETGDTDWPLNVAPAIKVRIEAERDRADREAAAASLHARCSDLSEATVANQHEDKISLRTEITELRELLRVARCPNQECDGGVIPVPLGEHFVTRDMATDAGEPSMEGQSMGIEWGAEQCQWCYERDEAIEKKLSKEVGDG